MENYEIVILKVIWDINDYMNLVVVICMILIFKNILFKLSEF